MHQDLKDFAAIAAIACAGLGVANPGWACMDTAISLPPPALHLATPADLPAQLTLNPGQRIEFSIPHPENMSIELVGDLKLLSRPGDAHLVLGVPAEATQVDGRIRFPGTEAIFQRCTPAATVVRLVRRTVAPPSIREVDVDLTQAERVLELSRKPVRIDGRDVLKVTLASDNPDVVMTANGPDCVKTRSDWRRSVFSVFLRAQGHDSERTVKTADLRSEHGFFQGRARKRLHAQQQAPK